MRGGVPNQRKYAKGGTLPRDGTKELSRLLQIAATNLLRSCLDGLEKRSLTSKVDVESELLVQVSGS